MKVHPFKFPVVNPVNVEHVKELDPEPPANVLLPVIVLPVQLIVAFPAHVNVVQVKFPVQVSDPLVTLRAPTELASSIVTDVPEPVIVSPPVAQERVSVLTVPPLIVTG